MRARVWAGGLEAKVQQTKPDFQKRKRKEKTLPTSIWEKETLSLKTFLRRFASPLHHNATNLKTVVGIWRLAGSARLQDLAVRSNIDLWAFLTGLLFGWA
eukprot:1159416-Pelagomonas_calceolata.AAC.19